MTFERHLVCKPPDICLLFIWSLSCNQFEISVSAIKYNTDLKFKGKLAYVLTYITKSIVEAHGPGF